MHQGMRAVISHERRPLCFIEEGVQTSLCDWLANLDSWVVYQCQGIALDFTFLSGEFSCWINRTLMATLSLVYMCVEGGWGEECTYLKRMFSVIIRLELSHFYDGIILKLVETPLQILCPLPLSPCSFLPFTDKLLLDHICYLWFFTWCSYLTHSWLPPPSLHRNVSH